MTERFDGPRRWANLLGALAQIGAPALVPLGITPVDIGARSEAVRTPVVPAGYAFSIWGLIFALALLYAVRQLRPAMREDPLLRRIGWWTAAAFAGDAAWIVAAQSGAPDQALAGLILLVFVAALGALLRLASWPARLSTGAWFSTALPVGLLAGWLSAALFANLSTALESAREAPWPDAVWAGLIAAAALLASGVLLRTRGQPAYAAAVLWALAALVAANWTERDGLPALTAAAGCGAVLLAAFVGRRRSMSALDLA